MRQRKKSLAYSFPRSVKLGTKNLSVLKVSRHIVSINYLGRKSLQMTHEVSVFEPWRMKNNFSENFKSNIYACEFSQVCLKSWSQFLLPLLKLMSPIQDCGRSLWKRKEGRGFRFWEKKEIRIVLFSHGGVGSLKRFGSFGKVLLCVV